MRESSQLRSRFVVSAGKYWVINTYLLTEPLIEPLNNHMRQVLLYCYPCFMDAEAETVCFASLQAWQAAEVRSEAGNLALRLSV